MVITIIHCEFRVLGAGVVVYRRTLYVFVQKLCMLSLPRKTLQLLCSLPPDTSTSVLPALPSHVWEIWEGGRACVIIIIVFFLD